MWPAAVVTPILTIISAVSKIKNRDNLLGIAAILFLFIGFCNALDYFALTKNGLKKVNGVVSKVHHENYEGRRSRYRGRVLYTRTIIYLDGLKKKFWLTDEADDGGYVDVNVNDYVSLYKKKWYQVVYNFQGGGNMYYVEKDNEPVYDDLPRLKASAFVYMCFSGGCAFFLLLMFLSTRKWSGKKKNGSPSITTGE